METFEKCPKDSPLSTKKSGGQPSKLIDLGAAATFAQQAETSNTVQSTQQTDSLLSGISSQGSTEVFADFKVAFTSPPEENQSAGKHFFCSSGKS